MQVTTVKPVDGCQDPSAHPIVRPAAAATSWAGPPSQSNLSTLHNSILFLSEVCDQVSNSQQHPLGLFKPAPSIAQPSDNIMALPLADVVCRSTDPDQAAWSDFAAGQEVEVKSAGRLSHIPPSSPISPSAGMPHSPVSTCFGPQLLGAVASVGPGPTLSTANVPAGALPSADAPVSPSPPPRRRPRRRTDGPVKTTAKPRGKARALGRKASPGSSPVGSAAILPVSSRRKPAGATGTPSHTCKVPGCNRAFARTYNLSTHMRTHTGDCPYECEDKSCAKKFKWKSSLTSHRKYHEKREADERAAEAASAAAAAAAVLDSATTEDLMSAAESTENEAGAAAVARADAPRWDVQFAPVGMVYVQEAQVGEAAVAAAALAKLRVAGSSV